jgi:hypothetical protein
MAEPRYTFDKKSVDRLARMSRDFMPRQNDVTGQRVPKYEMGGGGGDSAGVYQGTIHIETADGVDSWDFLIAGNPLE